MNPTAGYDLRPGEWRPDPPHVAYGCDRNGIAVLLEAEQRASPWTSGESEAGPAIEVEGRVLGAPPSADDIEHLVAGATPAPYGRGEETVLDPKVRQALQVEARHVRLGGPRWVRLREAMLGMVAEEMGLDDAKLDLVALKLLVYRPGGHFQAHADTEKTPGMVASAALVAPGAYRGGTLVIEHAGERLKVGAGGALRWRWAAWYADCRHRLEPVEDGVRIAMTFAVAVDAERALAPREARNHELRWALWDRSYAERHSAWAARGARIGAGNEQYGQKLVWVLEHRYTEPGLRACLLKGRDRDLARVLIDDRHGEACYLGWLQIREVGPARDAQGASVGDHGPGWYGAEDDDDDDPPPQTLVDRDHRYWEEEEWVRRIAHRETPTLHLRDVARQNAWVEGLRSLEGEAADHGPIEVRDGEVVPPGALAHAAPDAARVYEATGNEGAALELQYRSAVLVLWRRNRATLRMLARCGGRLALAVELDRRGAEQRQREAQEGSVEEALALWPDALATDGGGPAPGAHRRMLERVAEREEREGVESALRARYVETVAAIDLDAEAAPSIARWLGERIEAATPVDDWVEALRGSMGGRWGSNLDVMPGVPALLRALCASPETGHVAQALLGERDEPPTSIDAVLEEVGKLETRLEEEAWRRRRRVRWTADEAGRSAPKDNR